MSTTITISTILKKKLERLKGNMTWEEFLGAVAEKLERAEKEKVAKEYMKHFSISDAEAEFILKEIEESRRRWRETSKE